MEKVFLRVYNHEIESMIETGQLDEAVAHCQHILRAFPMHVETYRLLGKSFLEAKRYADAADIFQRVLMTVPDDFVAHVGMSIIRDDEGKLDDAIWHMARAFEIQPSNTAIQGELRRLYGRRDGSEPSKIRLSRDALANMYAQGELFTQAIAEIRTVLAEDPDRPDLQVMLARSYYRSGQKVEAAEMAATLLKKFPYCMDALRVLVDVLPGTARAENMQVYNARLQMLDPYQAFATDSAFAVDKVGDSAVDLGRLEYRPGTMPGSPQPDWASSLGIKLNAESKAETQPTWLQSSETEELSTAPVPNSSEPMNALTSSSTEETVPEWMKDAGWSHSGSDSSESEANAEESLQEEQIARADIPGWLKSMAPADGAVEAGKAAEESAESLPLGTDGIPEWLKPNTQLNSAEVSHTEPDKSTESYPAIDEEVPDWIRSEGLPRANEPEREAVLENPAESKAAEAADVPDWLKSMAPVESVESNPDMETDKFIEPQPSEAAGLPDWIKSLAPTEAAEPSMVNGAETVEPLPGELPGGLDWLKSEVPEETIEPIAEIEPEKPGEPQPAEAADVPDWIKSMAPTEAVQSAAGMEPEKFVESQSEEIPDGLDWLKAEVPTETAKAIVETGPAKPVEAADVPDWLKSMAPVEAVESATESEPEKFVDAQSEEVPDELDWLKAAVPAETAEPVAEMEPEQPVDVQPAEAADVPDWLKSMAPVEAVELAAEVESEQLIEPPLAEAADMPDWLKSMAPTESNEPASLMEPEKLAEGRPLEITDMPDWLKTTSSTDANVQPMDLDTKKAVEPLSEDLSDIPAWLKSSAPASANEIAQTDEYEEPAISQPVSGEEAPTITGSMAVADTAGSLEVESEFLNREAPIMESEPEQTPDKKNPMDDGALPDWLKDLGNEAASEEEAAPVVTGGSLLEPLQHLPPEPVVGLVDTQPVSLDQDVTDQSASREFLHPDGSALDASGIPSEPTGPVTPLGIGDDAFAWLESLAAKQGAKAEELLTKPEDRTSEMPEYLRQAGAQDGDVPTPSVQLPLRPPSETVPPGSLGELNEPSALTPVQGDEEPPRAEEEILSGGLSISDVAPTVVQPVSESINDWIPETLVELPVAAAPEDSLPGVPEIPVDDTTITSWLSKKDVEEALVEKIPEAPDSAQQVEHADELPDWLKDLEKPATLATPVASVDATKVQEDLPEWLRSPISPVVSEPVAPIVESEPTRETNVPAWVDETNPASGEAAPTSPEEWIPVESPLAENLGSTLAIGETNRATETAPVSEPEPVPEPVAIPKTAPSAKSEPVEEAIPVIGSTSVVEKDLPSSIQPEVQAPAKKQTGTLSQVPAKDRDAEVLSNAQATLEQNSLDDAMKQYSKLIKRGHLLDEVVHDLREATYRHPVDVIVWQTLGDAYMRSGRLQDALDAYTKAEELLR